MENRLKTAIVLVPFSIFVLWATNLSQSISESLGQYLKLWELAWSPDPFHQCTHSYTVEILSVDPLIVYINNFLKEDEVEYMLSWSQNQWEPSLQLTKDEKVIRDPGTTALGATMPLNDPVSQCLSARIKSFLGNIQHIDTEPIRLVKYENYHTVRFHVDWYPHTRNKTWIADTPHRPNNRLGSTFAYLEDDCDGGETFFPDVQGVSSTADGSKFSRTESGKGLLVKPRRGNAVFWNNMLPNGTGDLRVNHAAMPVRNGTKVGLNLFSHYYLDAPLIG